MLKRVSFGAKLMLGIGALVVVTILLMGVVNYYRVNNAVTQLGRAMIENVADQIEKTVQMQNEITQEKVNADLALMDMVFSQFGQVNLDYGTDVTMEITNQVTKKTETVTIPALRVGQQKITQDFTIVDQVQNTVGGTATIFQVLPGKLLRVSTNVKKLDGERATGTYIPSSSPVYKTVMQGETFRGRAYVVNAWYITAYKPMRDASGQIVAVIYVGRRIMTPQIEDYLRSVNIAGEGYAFVFNGQGEFLLHPEKQLEAEGNLKDFSFGPRLMEADDELVEYEYGGQKLSYIKYFEPWDWYIGIGLTRKEMLHGVDQKIMTSVLVGGLAALALAVLVSMLLSSYMVRPLKRMMAVATKIGQGDMKARMEVKSWDEVGQLAKTFNDVMDKIDEAMCDNEGYINMLNAVSDPIFAVDDDYNIIMSNEATAKLAGTDMESIKGRRCSEVFNAKVCGTDDCPICRAKEQKGKYETEIVELTIDGEQRFVKPTGDILRDCDGELIGYVEVAKDVTELVRKENELKENFDHINRVNEQIASTGRQISSYLESLSSLVGQVRGGADLQSQRTSETATAMEEMNATVMEVAKNASNAAENADQAKSKATEGAEVVQKAVDSIAGVQRQVMDLQEKMANLGDQAESIGQIINVINDIADQTNLLALNAAIEAARAGEAGRGFAVVADEVRKLAEKTMGATKEVESAIGTIQSGTREAMTATEQAAEDINESTKMAKQSGERLDEILELVGSTTAQVSSIATAAEEQSAASEEINRSIEEVSRISAETAEGMGSAADSVDELSGLADKLAELSK